VEASGAFPNSIRFQMVITIVLQCGTRQKTSFFIALLVSIIQRVQNKLPCLPWQRSRVVLSTAGCLIQCPNPKTSCLHHMALFSYDVIIVDDFLINKARLFGFGLE
jgi:hypothetical protein